jgi:hypothetical protein
MYFPIFRDFQLKSQDVAMELILLRCVILLLREFGRMTQLLSQLGCRFYEDAAPEHGSVIGGAIRR